MAKQVTKDTIITEALAMDEGIAQILMQSGMHCLGCLMASGESIGQASQAHGVEADTLVGNINAYLAQN